jgi:hypothetical protein
MSALPFLSDCFEKSLDIGLRGLTDFNNIGVTNSNLRILAE